MLIVEGSSKEEVLQRSEVRRTALRRLVDDGLLAGFDLPSLYLPSDASQRKRQAALPLPMCGCIIG